ncbi:unnamed protein product [Pieris brassicae]|uniref:Kelch domain-containing protein 3 n=1 Tax=Pieris brassicae TaxID=7116 RepID=A0A9P0TQ49_PIEBR|nr:unnamed protein product [Pieris brassicae]
MYWTLHTHGGPRRVNHAAARVGDKIYSFGGYSSLEEYQLLEPISVHVLDTAIYKWAPVDYGNLKEAPFQRYGHTCVAYGDKIYLWGGRNYNVPCDIVYCFDTEELKGGGPLVTGRIPNGKDGHSACIVNNKMYIFGGFDYITDEYTNNLHYLNLHTMEWCYVCAKGSPPVGRDFHTALAYGDRMYIFGGRSELSRPHSNDQEYYCDLVYYFDTLTETWVKVKARGVKPDGRRSHSSWIHNDFMYIFGGYNDRKKTHYNDIHRYSLLSNHWEFINVYGTPPCKRRRQVCILHKDKYSDKVYLFGGTSPTDHVPVETKDDESEDEERVLDKDDLHLLEYLPSLKVLCIMYINKNKMNTTDLPKDLLVDIQIMTQPNKISSPIEGLTNL